MLNCENKFRQEKAERRKRKLDDWQTTRWRCKQQPKFAPTAPKKKSQVKVREECLNRSCQHNLRLQWNLSLNFVLTKGKIFYQFYLLEVNIRIQTGHGELVWKTYLNDKRSGRILSWRYRIVVYKSLSSRIIIFTKSALKFIYSEKATKFCETFPLLLTTVHTYSQK